MKELSIHDSWDKHLLPLLSSAVGQELINSLEDTNYHPNKKDIFKAFSIPLNSVKLVIVGQDVYPDKSLATGIALGVPLGKDSASLKTIRKELHRQYQDNITSDYFLSTIEDIDFLFDNTMEWWQEQGILMLNSALTCSSKPGDQWDLWQPFMSELISIISITTKAPFIFLGKKAATLQKLVKNHSKVFPHPASYDKQQFVGCGIFDVMDDLVNNEIKWIRNSSISSHGEAQIKALPF